MNIHQTLELFFGGPGSGCNPDVGKCGRPKGSKSDVGKPYERPTPKKVDTVQEAVKLILKGHVVELASVQEVNTLIRKLAKITQDAKKRGKNAPNYDLCKVSVANTNVFCVDAVRTPDYPEGIPRLAMPQISGVPVEGSQADKLPRRAADPTEVDGADAFVKHLESLGISAAKERVRAASLRASQHELNGPKVAVMMLAAEFDPGEAPIFVSRDNYVVDGHHRWAAVVGRDTEDGIWNSDMNVVRIDAPVSEILLLANKWAKDFGIKQKSAK